MRKYIVMIQREGGRGKIGYKDLTGNTAVISVLLCILHFSWPNGACGDAGVSILTRAACMLPTCISAMYIVRSREVSTEVTYLVLLRRHAYHHWSGESSVGVENGRVRRSALIMVRYNSQVEPIRKQNARIPARGAQALCCRSATRSTVAASQAPKPTSSHQPNAVAVRLSSHQSPLNTICFATSILNLPIGRQSSGCPLSCGRDSGSWAPLIG
ncbi:hypothetical protein F5Y12DRAFT_413501 [Xylaria sp. FL1777]|nr:hypothetical protein F5Y12DRAFT_413501 [Xylaria sp. FL1777]